MFGLFKSKKPRQNDLEITYRNALALYDPMTVNPLMAAIKAIAGNKLTDEECLKCAKGVAVGWNVEFGRGGDDVNLLKSKISRSYPGLSPLQTAEIVRLVVEVPQRPYEEVVRRVMELQRAGIIPSKGQGPAQPPPQAMQPPKQQTPSPGRAASDPDEPTIWLNADTVEQRMLLRSAAGQMQASHALVVMLLLTARSRGWTGASQLFTGENGTNMVVDLKRATISGRDARALRLQFEPHLAAIDKNAEGAKDLVAFMALLDGSDLHIESI